MLENTAFADADWLNEPANWTIDPTGTLCASSDSQTDFWRTTYYDFLRDNGHALLHQWNGEFTASLTFAGDYQALYDQAGLMVRNGDESWAKFGIELTDGETHLSSVVTHDRSDWSARQLPEAARDSITIRITRLRDALLLQSGNLDGRWQMERLAPWPLMPSAVRVGPYLCSPKRAGFAARFTDFQLSQPLQTELHD